LLRRGASAQGQTGVYPSFPYCQCTPKGLYSMSQSVTSLGGGQYCFNIVVSPPAGCTTRCCTTADLRKIEVRLPREQGLLRH
jgi:hypothetical protein